MAYPTYDLVMIRQMRLARLAAVDLLRVQVDVVREAHLGGGAACRWALLLTPLGSLLFGPCNGLVGLGFRGGSLVGRL